MLTLVLGTPVGKFYYASTLVLLAVGMDAPTSVRFNSTHIEISHKTFENVNDEISRPD
jgi:hypothetical protein